MKYALVTLLVTFNPVGAIAQKNNFFADAGISLARFHPGASITYNYDPLPHIGVGMGVQDYDFHATMTTFQMIPTVFGELRINIRPGKSNQFFVFFDLGVNFYQHNNDYWRKDNMTYTVKTNNGSYEGLGIAYAWRVKKTDVRYYISLKMISNSYDAQAYNQISGEHSTARMGDATLVTSFGLNFK